MLSSGMFWKDCSIFTNKASSTEISKVHAVLTRMCVVCTHAGIDMRTCFSFEVSETDIAYTVLTTHSVWYCLSASIIADNVYIRTYIHTYVLYTYVHTHEHTCILYLCMFIYAYMLGIHDVIIAYYHNTGVHTIEIQKGKLLLGVSRPLGRVYGWNVL